MAQDYEFGTTIASIASQQVSMMSFSLSQLSIFSESQKLKSLSCKLRDPMHPRLSTIQH